MGNLGVKPDKELNNVSCKLPMLLTPRERQILEMICDGMSNEEIAKALDIQEMTVKFHLKKVYDAFHVSRRHTVIIEAVRIGMVRPSWINELASTV